MQNAYYEKDIRYTMQLCERILKSIGIYHLIYGRATRNEKLVSIVLIIMCLFVLCFVVIPSGFYILFREKDINVKVKLFGPVGFCLTCTIKYCYIGMRAAGFRKCIRHVENDWRAVQHQNHREIMLRNTLMGRRITILCVMFLFIGGMSYHTIMPLMSKTKTNDTYTVKPLVYPGYDFYFDPQISPVYEIVFLLHCLSAMVQYSVTTAACSLAAIFATHACGQLQILITLFDNLIDEEQSKNTTVEKRLGVIVKNHVRILRFTADVEKVLREICLMELIASTLIICLLEYYCLTEWENNDAIAILTYTILLISFTFNILIFCYIGELLVEQYSKIGSSIYNINWYNLPGNKALGLLLIITMSQYPPKLTAGKICDLSISTFGAVLKASLVYLNLLRTVTK